MTYEIELLSTSGKVTPFELSSSLVEYGNRPAVMVVFRDISAKRKQKNISKRLKRNTGQFLKKHRLESFILTGKAK